MRYLEHCDWHALFLTEEETNTLFTAFDPTDNDMPGYLHRAGHRYIKTSVYEWLEANVGQPYLDWRHSGTRHTREMLFQEKEKALLFKLTFSQ